MSTDIKGKKIKGQGQKKCMVTVNGPSIDHA
jgi:hypothetical protein